MDKGAEADATETASISGDMPAVSAEIDGSAPKFDNGITIPSLSTGREPDATSHTKSSVPAPSMDVDTTDTGPIYVSGESSGASAISVAA